MKEVRRQLEEIAEKLKNKEIRLKEARKQARKVIREYFETLGRPPTEEEINELIPGELKLYGGW